MDNIKLPSEYETTITRDDHTIVIRQEMDGHPQEVEFGPERAMLVANSLIAWAKDKAPKDMRAYNRERQAAHRAKLKAAREGGQS